MKNNLNNFLRKKSFTLVELLVVIMIIMILTLITVSSYGGAQRHIQLDFAADTLVAIIKEQSAFARSGMKSGESLLCFALKIEDSAVSTARSNYSAVDEGVVDQCDEANFWKTVDVLSDGMKITVTSSTSTSTSTSPLEIYYKPPFGKAVKKENGIFSSYDSSSSIIYLFEISFESDPLIYRKVSYSPAKGEVYRIQNNN